jgi:hypothetical protein
VRLCCRRFQQGHGRGVGFELLPSFDTERQEHSHHFKVAGLHGLFVQRAGEVCEEGLVKLHDAVIEHVAQVEEALREW